MSTQLAPLYHLLHKDIHWNWTHKEDEAFKAAKKEVTNQFATRPLRQFTVGMRCFPTQFGGSVVPRFREW